MNPESLQPKLEGPLPPHLDSPHELHVERMLAAGCWLPESIVVTSPIELLIQNGSPPPAHPVDDDCVSE